MSRAEAVDGAPLSLLLVLARQPAPTVPEDVPPDPPDDESVRLLEEAANRKPQTGNPETQE